MAIGYINGGRWRAGVSGKDWTPTSALWFVSGKSTADVGCVVSRGGSSIGAGRSQAAPCLPFSSMAICDINGGGLEFRQRLKPDVSTLVHVWKIDGGCRVCGVSWWIYDRCREESSRGVLWSVDSDEGGLVIEWPKVG
ncbi:hypothetical protein OROGR_031322 [Orobanche gracilis]